MSVHCYDDAQACSQEFWVGSSKNLRRNTICHVKGLFFTLAWWWQTTDLQVIPLFLPLFPAYPLSSQLPPLPFPTLPFPTRVPSLLLTSPDPSPSPGKFPRSSVDLSYMVKFHGSASLHLVFMPWYLSRMIIDRNWEINPITCKHRFRATTVSLDWQFT